MYNQGCELCSNPYPYNCTACMSAQTAAMREDAIQFGIIKRSDPPPPVQEKAKGLSASETAEAFKKLFIGSGEDCKLDCGC